MGKWTKLVKGVTIDYEFPEEVSFTDGRFCVMYGVLEQQKLAFNIERTPIEQQFY